MSFTFLHSSDLHLGRKFASIPQAHDGNIRGRLMEARHTALDRLAAAAKDKGAGHILLAGDTFDTATPSHSIVLQALRVMEDAAPVIWWLLPGNHDNLRDAEPLWDLIRAKAPANVHVLAEAAPVHIADGATLLPCPAFYRTAGTDPTEALPNMPSPDGHLRIGLAHGGVTDFTESGNSIAPDRDRSARLDYLALGDWHGCMTVSDRTRYCGSPEQDQFKHDRRGVCLSVTLDAPGQPPQVEEVEIGQFLWTEVTLPLHPGQNAAEALAARLPATGRRDILLRLTVSGWAGLADQADLRAAATGVAPEFAHFELRTDALNTQHDAADLDQIDRSGGALRIAAETLAEASGDDSAPPEDRAAAADALARLFSYVREDVE
ncbi:metallophosphoesterase family protein [Pseudoprimorskyibacter insulae]|uniref:Putative metallophosphoesterase YhaO n=1 Tax=Pseudoprimorskyibacter insulae TaxID=1695997 RepID=A0A2R8B0U0_9RHOB|nr:metallophosphoesterase [Pseudoprimorskyibacter insulae]SPF81860.1 putative metallophosphoesterase YhaO [Pseudoprimorskyibacter insulae]